MYISLMPYHKLLLEESGGGSRLWKLFQTFLFPRNILLSPTIHNYRIYGLRPENGAILIMNTIIKPIQNEK